MLTIILAGVTVLLVLAPLAGAIRQPRIATGVVYGTSFIVSAVGLAAALLQLLSAAPPLTLALPLGVPWLGAHFRLDALSAFFLVVVDLGAFGRKPVRARLRPA